MRLLSFQVYLLPYRVMSLIDSAIGCRLQIEDASSRPYIAELRSLGSSATAKSSTASDFSTIFFPAADCDGESKKEVTTDGASEVSDEVSFSFGDVESLRNPTPGWISETRDIERQDFNGIVCRLKRHNTPSDESFKATNLHWKTLVEGLMARSVGEKENQAKVLQTVRKPYRLKYDSEDDDGVHEEIDMELEKLSSGASRLRKLAEATAESGLPCDHITCRGCLRNLKRLISRKRLEWIR
jgi:hypothetical protein